MHDKEEYVLHIWNLKQALNHGLVLKKVHKSSNINQKAWLKPYTDMNIDLIKKAKNDLERDFLKLMNNAVFGKTMANVRKHRVIKLVTTEKRRNYLVSESNYHTTKNFSENLLAIEMRKIQILMNKPVYLGLSVWELSKIVVYEFWYGHVQPKYGEKAKLCYMDTDSFIVYIMIFIRHCRMCWNKVWHFKSWVEQSTSKRKERESYWCNERWIRWKNHERIC